MIFCLFVVMGLTLLFVPLEMEVSETDIAQMVQEADLDGDGAISFEEFILLVFHNKQTQHDNTLRVAFDVCLFIFDVLNSMGHSFRANHHRHSTRITTDLLTEMS